MSSTDFRRTVYSFVLCLPAIFTLGASGAHAQAYPSKTIEWISHSSAGSGTDLFNRNVSGMLEKEKILNVPFIHTNRVGGNGVIAYRYLRDKKGDPILTQSILPDTGLALDSLTPIIRFAQDPQVVAVRTESKFKTYKELINAARDGNVVAGITGPTGSGRAALYYIERDTGAKFKYVTYKGGGDAVLSTLGGHVDVTTENMSEMLPLVEGGKMRILAVTGERRFKQVPDVPTLKELGVEGGCGHNGKGAEAGPRQPGLQRLRRPQYVRGRVLEQRRLRESARRAARGAARVSESDRHREVTAR
jgi:putative tricarboxylic transport membrane protein